MKTDRDVLANSIQTFLKWRNEASCRKDCKTREQYLNYCGVRFSLYKDNKNGINGYCFGIDNAPFRKIGFCDEIRKSIDHRGWFKDNIELATVRGIVFRLSSSKRKERFIVGYYQNDNDKVVLNLSKIFDDSDDAALYSDRLTEKFAEESRKYDAKNQAELDIENLREEIHASGKHIIKLIREFKSMTKEVKLNLTVYPVLKDAICSKLRSLLDDRKRAFKRIAALQDNYWLSVEV